jgi:hypothetical protein
LYIIFWSESLKGKDNLGNPDVYGRVTIKQALEEQGVKVWYGFNWLRIRSADEISCITALHFPVP